MIKFAGLSMQYSAFCPAGFCPAGSVIASVRKFCLH
jgi:hypothetical protein